MRHILAATDGSAGADRAVDLASELAKATGAHLLILTVQDPIPAEAAEAFAAIEHVTKGEVTDIAGRGTLVRAQARAARKGVDASMQLETGDPTEAILKIAGERGIDTIVVGKRGCGQLRGLLLGSVSQKLVSLAPCTVVIVP
jgi:nucleotide-binding universal stress UspA family protein